MFDSQVDIKDVVIYTRVSTGEQVLGFSLETQLEDLKKECEYRNYNILEHFIDAGKSGGTIEKREGFLQMMKFVKNNKVDAVMVWKLSRFSRNTLDLLTSVQFLKEYNTHLISLKDSVNTTTRLGSLFMTILGSLAEMERENIVTQVKSNMKSAAEKGKWMGGIAPLGYKLVNKKLIVNEEESKIVNTIFKMYANGNGYSKLCQFLNKDLVNYGTRKGNKWSYATLKQILDNPVYIGKIRWGVHSDWKTKHRGGKKQEGEYVLEKGDHNAIISDELWEQVRQRRIESTKQEARKREVYHLLSGLPKCPDCGASMVSNCTPRTNKRTGEKTIYKYYVCNNWNNSKTCRPNSVKADILEKQVLDELYKFVRNENLVQELEKRFNESVNIDELEREANNIEKVIKKLNDEVNLQYENLGDKEFISKLGKDGKDKIANIILSKNQLIEEHNINLEKLRKQIKAVKENTLNYQKIALMLKNFEKIFPKASHVQQKDLLHTLVKEIRVQNNVNIDLRTATEIILNFNEQDIMKFTNNEENSDDKNVWFICDTVHP